MSVLSLFVGYVGQEKRKNESKLDQNDVRDRRTWSSCLKWSMDHSRLSIGISHTHIPRRRNRIRQLILGGRVSGKNILTNVVSMAKGCLESGRTGSGFVISCSQLLWCQQNSISVVISYSCGSKHPRQAPVLTAYWNVEVLLFQMASSKTKAFFFSKNHFHLFRHPSRQQAQDSRRACSAAELILDKCWDHSCCDTLVTLVFRIETEVSGVMST